MLCIILACIFCDDTVIFGYFPEVAKTCGDRFINIFRSKIIRVQVFRVSSHQTIVLLNISNVNTYLAVFTVFLDRTVVPVYESSIIVCADSAQILFYITTFVVIRYFTVINIYFSEIIADFRIVFIYFSVIGCYCALIIVYYRTIVIISYASVVFCNSTVVFFHRAFFVI